MEFSFSVPVNIISGKGCINKHADLFSEFGKKAFIISGASAEKNGANADVEAVFSKKGILLRGLFA